MFCYVNVILFTSWCGVFFFFFFQGRGSTVASFENLYYEKNPFYELCLKHQE